MKVLWSILKDIKGRYLFFSLNINTLENYSTSKKISALESYTLDLFYFIVRMIRAGTSLINTLFATLFATPHEYPQIRL